MTETLSDHAPSFSTKEQDVDELEAEDLPDPQSLPEIRIYSHSTLFYWWPVWVAGFVMAAITYFKGGTIELDNVRQEWFHPSAGVGVTYVLILLLVILFTNVKFRGIYSVVLLLSVALITALIALWGWWDELAALIPQLSVHMNMGFYLVFSSVLFVMWCLQFFVFDRLIFWRVRPGQMTEEHVIGGGEKSYDSRGMLFEERGDDFIRHGILGLGSGDLVLITSGAKEETIYIPNVTFANAKVRSVQKLIAIKPDELLNKTD